MTALTPAGSVDAVNVQPGRVRRVTAVPEPSCKCGHAKARHRKKRGQDWWLQCRWQYEPGNGRCHCGMYRPAVPAQTGSNPTNHTPEEIVMSYDIYLEIDTGSEDLATVAEVGDYTSNVSGMWATALGHSLGDLDGTNAGDAVAPLTKAVAAMEATPALYRAIGPANGWGSYDGALGCLRTLRDLCGQHPKTTIRVSR